MMLALLKKNAFVAGVFLSLASGFAAGPHAAVLNPGGLTSRSAVVILFLITGLTLRTDRILHDLSNPRLHLFLQAYIFVVFPLYFLTAAPLFGTLLDGALLVGFFALATLPTTIGSCVVFTHAVRGNTAAAVFNSALANMAGILVSPLLLSLLLSGSRRVLPSVDLGSTLQGLVTGMLLPMVAGQLLRRMLAVRIDAHRRGLSSSMSSLILVVVFFAFARTAENPDFATNLRVLPLPLVYLAFSHLLLVALAHYASGWFGFKPADRLAVLFVAPQKTLAMGAPMLTLCFPDPVVLGVVLLPILFYHPFQLLTAGILKSMPFVRRLEHEAVEAENRLHPVP
jgi:sodium/bile acid cotransporter 7